MNRNGHLLSSSILLNIGMGAWLIVLYYNNNITSLIIAGWLSFIFFLVGTSAPDYDHWKVQEILHIKWLIGKFTKHRGHFHSIIGCIIYTFIIFLPIFFLGIKYWYIICLFSFLGYFSHLVEDELMNILAKMKGKRPGAKCLKIW